MDIKFAVWNIDRAATNSDDLLQPGKTIQEYAAEMRIRRLLDNNDLDFIFLQEVPNPRRMPGLFLRGWIPHPDKRKQGTGILFFQTENSLCKHRNLAFRRVQFPGSVRLQLEQDPIGAAYSIFNKNTKKEILRFIGFWNASEGQYLQHLLSFLNSIFYKLHKKTLEHCILAGDTNVNVRTENEKPGRWTDDGIDLNNHLKSMKKGLVLINGDADQYTHRWKTRKNVEKNKWFRCDLLIASSECKIHSVSFGEKSIYMDYRSCDNCHGSDHLPLFFTVSVPD